MAVALHYRMRTMEMVADPVSAGRETTTDTMQPGKLVTHRFALGDIMKAYDTFGNAAKERALKVILTNGKAGNP